MNAIDQLRDRDTIESTIIVALYDESCRRANFDGRRKAFEDLAEQIVKRLAQDEEPEETDIFF